ncbi:MAG TPA: transglutaminase family protein [Phototrophicaceae bacterium]|nr:transglutaminase family protein [Phototrophicaceae bacterium]
MYYAVKHETTFRYSDPISESVMEVYMQPRTEGIQRCLRFNLLTYPRARAFEHYDYLGNIVHSFDIPTQHDQLKITAESIVELIAPPPLPNALDAGAWDTLDQVAKSGEFWDMLEASPRTMPSEALRQFAQELDVNRNTDPLSLLHQINTRLFNSLDYSASTTDVDSPIDVALAARKGVCQDFAHIMIALVRSVGIPCRYVSGYLFFDHHDRSTPDATHAWVEAYLPQIGWIGFDPTNNLIAGERHIRVAIGRDYNDVPPTRGVFKGKAESELAVAVHITPTESPYTAETLVPVSGWLPEDEEHSPQQQQQQQQ